MRFNSVVILILTAVSVAGAQSPYTQVDIVPSPQSQPAPVPQTAPPPQGTPPPQMMSLPHGMGAPQGMPDLPPNPIARMYAIYGHGAVPEQPYMDETLKPIVSALSELPFTSYEAVSILDGEVPWGEETRYTVNAKYNVNVVPLGQDEEGAIQLNVRIEMLQEDGTYVDALNAQALAAQNGALLFRGMPLNRGELVVVLLVGMPPDPNQKNQDTEEQQEQSEGEQEQQEQEEQQQEQEQEKKEEGESSEEQEMNPAEETTGEGEQENHENLEALLESLEDTDKQEQKEERNQRDRIDFKGDWW